MPRLCQWPQALALLLATAAAINCPGGTAAAINCPGGTAAAINCPGGTALVDLFELNGTRWAACEDLQVPGGALVLVSSSGATEWFHKTHETYGSAPLGSDDAYYLNLTKKAAVADKTDVLAVKLLGTEEGLTWSRVASAVPPIRHAGVRTFVGSRGSVADTSFTDAGEDAAGYGFPPPMSFVFNLTNLAEGGKPIVDPAQYVNSSRMAEGLVGDFLPIVIFYFPLVTGSPYLPPNSTAAKGGGRYWTMIASPEPDMHGSREQRVWFRFAQLECAGAALEPPCALVGTPQHWDTYWWSHLPAGGATNASGPPAAAAAGGFYGSLLANRRWWAAELAAEGMMHLALPSPASTNGTRLATQMVHNLIRGMITWHDTWGPRYGVLPGCE